MKKSFIFLLGIIMILASGLAQAATLDITFHSFIRGAVSYGAVGTDVVEPGSVFYDTLSTENLLDLDGVVGNLALWGIVEFTPNSDFLWAASHGDQELEIEIRLDGLKFDWNLDGNLDGNMDMADKFRMVGWQDGKNYLTTFNELGAHGYTELTAGVWMDVALGEAYLGYGGNVNGLTETQMAISIVMDGRTLTGYPFFEALLLPGALLPGDPGNTVGSGIHATTVPEPATMLLFGIGLLGFAGVSRRKK